MTEPLFLGIDAGGTKCAVRLCDASGACLGEGSGGPSNLRLDPERVWNSVLAATREALAVAGLDDTALRRVHAGMGAAGAGQASSLKRFLSRPHPFASLNVETDAHAAWLGAFGGRDGAILIVGTGSCGYGGVGGMPFQVGGWGYEISDEGSGAAIGRDALRHAVWAHDGRIAPTGLSSAILAEFEDEPENLVDWLGTALPRDYARFARVVLDHAEKRDPLAIEIIARASTDLGHIATRLLDLGAPALCLFGGLAEPLRPWLPPPVQRMLTQPIGDAMDGAILLARNRLTRQDEPERAATDVGR